MASILLKVKHELIKAPPPPLFFLVILHIVAVIRALMTDARPGTLGSLPGGAGGLSPRAS
ncbi:hypothetical protein FEA48_14505 [Pseudomonas nitroreducens]|uniref:Uncharacterized protein n=1 Tax=Pseudomonas nitroreducens TaxID=46680 RepID=A0A5R9A445_PSENT|nr:hypothetical protein [Pseudomonas nitroreducens]TLP73453.1 hypothetical protein FEA48_14505 [Pseudomonas nitroreducens]